MEDIKEPLMQELRYLDKLIDEVSKGKTMEKILRKSSIIMKVHANSIAIKYFKTILPSKEDFSADTTDEMVRCNIEVKQ